MISVLILTLNEERNIVDCLRSVQWSDDIVVLDSFSQDRTVELAESMGARVIQRSYVSERDQREFGIRHISFRHGWVYNPDADEITTPELRDEMLSVVKQTDISAVAFRVRFKTMLFQKWIRFSSLYPTWVVRLFRPEFLRFERETNLTYVVDGLEGRLQNHFLHYTFNNGFDAWFQKHNSYSKGEALETIRELRKTRINWWDMLAFSRPVQRRRALKRLSFSLPCRPLIRFLYMYLFRLGFLEGRAGFTYCRLLAIYEYMIVLKVREFRLREAGKRI
jgi:glycosyltransferase involved in cell wall biosynthesis